MHMKHEIIFDIHLHCGLYLNRILTIRKTNNPKNKRSEYVKLADTTSMFCSLVAMKDSN